MLIITVLCYNKWGILTDLYQTGVPYLGGANYSVVIVTTLSFSFFPRGSPASLERLMRKFAHTWCIFSGARNYGRLSSDTSGAPVS